VAEGGNDPAFSQQNSLFHFCLIECQQLQVVWVDQPVGSASSIRFIH